MIMVLLHYSLGAPALAPLQFDDVVVIDADGKSTIMKEHEWASLLRRSNIQSTPPTALQQIEPPVVRRRGCEQSSEVQIVSDTKFLNWDVPMSSLLSAQGGDATVSLSQGFQLSNSIQVSAEASISIVQDILSVSMSLSYSESWTTTQDQTVSFQVPDGQFGIIVSEPMVRRMQGNLLTGCTDSWDKSEFTSDTYSSQSFGNLNWVQGVIRLCNSSSYPVPFCVGDGFHQ